MNFFQERYRIKPALATGAGALIFTAPDEALAHASEQGFVLLLPTDIYILAGGASVGLTVLILLLLPERAVRRVYRPLPLWKRGRGRFAVSTSCASAFLLLLLILVGLAGPRDPLANPLPLAVWTCWWVGLVTLQGVLGDLWRWINPVSGPAYLLQRAFGRTGYLHLSPRFGYGLGIAGFLAFAAFLLADPAPSDPARLAGIVAFYWGVTLAGTLAFGLRWSKRADPVAMIMRLYARVGLFGPGRGGRIGSGLGGWQILSARSLPPGLAVLSLALLASGSFDGLNETFWYFAKIGINPLEFPGRSAVILPNLLGLLAANGALITVFAGAVWLGRKLARDPGTTLDAFCCFAPAVLPIALGYHIAHYLTAFMVEVQYVAAAVNDPLATGVDLFGLEPFYVTTGFFNTQASVRLIWLSQAGAVVLGHVLAVVLSHALALKRYGTGRRAALSQIPLAAFMIAYTFFGLWLLASPRGM